MHLDLNKMIWRKRTNTLRNLMKSIPLREGKIEFRCQHSHPNPQFPLMAPSTQWGSLSSSIRLRNQPFLVIALSFSTTSSSSPSMAADKFYNQLLKTPQNPEKTLATIKAKLDNSTVNEVLNKCSSTNHSHLGLRFFVWAGAHSNYRHARYMYGKACKLFAIDQKPERISTVLDAYRLEDCAVNVKLFKIVLGLCREANAANVALCVLRRMVEFGCRPDTTVYNLIIRMFCEKSEMDLAVGLMEEMGSSGCYPDVITYMEMIKGFCGVGKIEEACDLIKAMKSNGFAVNTVLYSTLLDAIFRSGCIDKGMELLEEMEKEGGECSPNVVTYTSAIQRFCEKRQFNEALCILDRMEGLGCAPNRVTVHTLVTGLCSEGLISEAHELVHKIAASGSVKQGECYSCLMISLLRVKRLDEAEKLFTWMLMSSIKPDNATSSSLIKALCLEGRALDGYDFYGLVEKAGFLSSIDSDVYVLLLDGLCRQNHLMEAVKLASVMAERRIQVKSSCIENIISHLNGSQELELLSTLKRIQNPC